jgi:2-oxoglutarate ferredoxin oxidoreductase subunit beta
LGAGATFLARSVDVFAKPLRATLIEAEAHKGCSLVEIYQNCNIFNDLAFDEIVNRQVKNERILFLEHEKPMVFGSEDTPKGLRLNGTKMEIIKLGDEFSEADCLVHDRANPLLASILVQLDYPDFPVPMGVIYQTEVSTYNEVFNLQIKEATEKKGKGTLKDLIYSGQTWTVE